MAFKGLLPHPPPNRGEGWATHSPAQGAGCPPLILYLLLLNVSIFMHYILWKKTCLLFVCFDPPVSQLVIMLIHSN